MSAEIRKIVSPTEDELNRITSWMYEWWGEREGYCFDAVKSYMKNSMNDTRLPKTFGLYKDGILIGIYQFTNHDLFVRPDIYPWLANVYIDKNYRNAGFGKILLESVKENAVSELDSDELYLFTNHKNLYERFGWEMFEEEETYQQEGIVSFYRLKLR